MLLTILTPTLDCKAHLAAALQSAERLQCLLPGRVQHLIGDAGSTDGTWQELTDYAERNDWVRLHRMPEFNIPATLNRLLRESRGDWILVLNGDDRLVPETIADCLAKADLAESAAVLAGHVVLETREGVSVGERGCNPSAIERFMSVNHAALLTPRRFFVRVGPFDERCSVSYDYEWLWRSRRLDVPLDHVSRVLARYRLGGISTRKRGRSNYEIFRAKWAAGFRWQALQYLCFNTMIGWVLRLGVARTHPLRVLGRRLTGRPAITALAPAPRHPQVAARS